MTIHVTLSVHSKQTIQISPVIPCSYTTIINVSLSSDITFLPLSLASLVQSFQLSLSTMYNMEYGIQSQNDPSFLTSLPSRTTRGGLVLVVPEIRKASCIKFGSNSRYVRALDLRPASLRRFSNCRLPSIILDCHWPLTDG